MSGRGEISVLDARAAVKAEMRSRQSSIRESVGDYEPLPGSNTPHPPTSYGTTPDVESAERSLSNDQDDVMGDNSNSSGSGETSTLLPLHRGNHEHSTRSDRFKAYLNERPTLKTTLGVFLAIFSGVIYTVNSFIIKQFHVEAVEALLVRGIVQTLILGGVILKSSSLQFWPEGMNWKTSGSLILQGVFGGIMTIATFISLGLIPIGDALTLIFSAPVFTCVFSKIFLGHRLMAWKVTFVVGLMAGVILVIQPPLLFPEPELNEGNDDDEEPALSEDPDTGFVVHDASYYIGALVALSCAIFGGLNSVCVGGPLKEIRSVILVFYVGFASLVIAFLASIFDHKQRILSSSIAEITGDEWGLLFGVAFLGMSAYFASTKSLQMIEPTVVSVLRSLEIVFAFVVQVAVMSEWPTMYGVVGASIVFVSVVLIAVERHVVRIMPRWLKTWM